MVEAERALVAVLLGEVPPREGAERMCAAVSRVAGVSCTLLEGHPPRGRDSAGADTAHLFLGDTTDETARTLVITRIDLLGPETLDRVKRLFERLIDIAYPIRRGGRTIHQLSNGLAGLMANIELMELLVDDAAHGHLEDAQRQELSTAIAYALESCRSLRTAIRNLAGVAGAQRAAMETDAPRREPSLAPSSAGSSGPSGRS